MEWVVFYFVLVGFIAGGLGGLFGVGGGFVYVPAQLILYQHIGIPEELQIKMAIQTSLAVVVISTLTASYSHHRKGGIDTHVVKEFIYGIVLGAIVGAFLTKSLSADGLVLFFGFFECLIGLYFLLSPTLHGGRSHWSMVTTNALGAVIGTLAILLGVGGGFFLVPLLILLNIPLRQSIGSSSLLTFVVAFVGSLVLLVHSSFHVQEPHAIGYLYIPAFIPLVIGAGIGAPLGARLTHALPTRPLKRAFGILLVILGMVVLS